MTDIEIYSEDFCSDDVEDINDLDELECMEENLQSQIYNNEEQNDILKKNVEIIHKRIKEIGVTE